MLTNDIYKDLVEEGEIMPEVSDDKNEKVYRYIPLRIKQGFLKFICMLSIIFALLLGIIITLYIDQCKFYEYKIKVIEEKLVLMEDSESTDSTLIESLENEIKRLKEENAKLKK